MNWYDRPELVEAVNKLLAEAQDVVNAADPAARQREMRELLLEAVKLGMVVAAHVAKATPTRIDDFAVSALRYSGLVDYLLNAMNDDEG